MFFVNEKPKKINIYTSYLEIHFKRFSEHFLFSLPVAQKKYCSFKNFDFQKKNQIIFLFIYLFIFLFIIIYFIIIET